MAGAEREGDVRTGEGSVGVFGRSLGNAFFRYAYEIREVDYKMSSKRGEIKKRRDLFIQALADKLTTGKREDVVLALDALLRAVDRKARITVRNLTPYNGPYAGH